MRGAHADSRLRGHRPGGHHRAQGLPCTRCPLGVACREGGVVAAQRAATHEDRVHPGAQRVALSPGREPRDPLARPVRRGHPAVEALGDLEAHERSGLLPGAQPSLVELPGLVGEEPGTHVDAVGAQCRPSPARLGRGVREGVDHAGHPGRLHGRRARTGASRVVARLQRDHQGGPLQRGPCRTGLLEHVHLGVGRAGPAVVPHVQQLSGGSQQGRAHHGVRPAHTAGGRGQGGPHPGGLGGREGGIGRGVHRPVAGRPVSRGQHLGGGRIRRPLRYHPGSGGRRVPTPCGTAGTCGGRPRGVVGGAHGRSSFTESCRSGKPVPIVAARRWRVLTRHHTKKPASVNPP